MQAISAYTQHLRPRVFAPALVLTLATSYPAPAAPEPTPQPTNALDMAGDLLVLAIVIGLILAAGAAAHLFLRAAARARQTAARANDAMTALRQELEVA